VKQTNKHPEWNSSGHNERIHDSFGRWKKMVADESKLKEEVDVGLKFI